MQMWVDVPGFTGYEVSDTGHVRNKRTGRILKDRRAINGGRRINLGKATRQVHNLVAIAFIGPRMRGFIVKHRNRNRRDNRLENLFYGRYGVADRVSGMKCSKGHDMSSALTWGRGGNHRICGECAAGKPRVLELPDVL